MMTLQGKKKRVGGNGAHTSKATNLSKGTTFPTISHPTMQSEIESGDVLSPGTKAYFRERLRNRLYDLIIRELEVYKAKGLTQTNLATRIGKGTDQISRLLSGPGNVTVDTVSDMLLGMSGAELEMTISHPHSSNSRNLRGPDWLTPKYEGISPNNSSDRPKSA